MEKSATMKQTARFAGLLYLAMGITSAYGINYWPSHPVLGGDGLAILKSIMNNEFLFRTKIVSQIVSSILFIPLALTLYKLFKQINEHQAKLMVIFVAVQVPIAFLLETFNITALMISKGEILKSFGSEEGRDLAIAFIKTRNYGVVVLEIFWGLWLIPFGQLVYKSGFIPRTIGLLLILGGIGYIIECLTILLLPDSRFFVSKYIFVFYYLAEVSIILWLLIKGVKDHSRLTPENV